MLRNSGQVLTFSSFKVNQFTGTGNTITAIYDPATGIVSEKNVTNTQHVSQQNLLLLATRAQKPHSWLYETNGR